MLPSTRHFLHSVRHDAKSSVKAVFSGPEGNIELEFEHFPKLFFPLRGLSEEDFIDALQSANISPRNVSFSGQSACLKFDSFADLKSAANSLESIFGFRPGIIEPERQFLVSMGWGYFDSFSFEGGSLVHVPLFRDAQEWAELGSEIFSRFGALERKKGIDFFERLAYSNLAKFPLFSHSSAGKGYAEIFLENVFFSSGAAFEAKKSSDKKFGARVFGPAEINFSRLVSAMISLPNTNLGPEAMNCACCRPESIDSQNVLPSSLVTVRFLKDGFFFNSVSRSWAEKFHAMHGSKDSREQRKSEYSFDFFPSGPFFRNETCDLLLPDAIAIQDHAAGFIVGISSAKWSCLKSRSMLSLEIERLRSCVSRADSFIDGISISTIASNGVFYSQALELSTGFLLAKALSRASLSILGSIPSMLSHQQSGFFDESLAFSIDSVSSAISKEIEQSGFDSGLRCGSSKDSKVLVDKAAVLSVSRRLSELYRLEKGLLEVRGWA